MQISEHFNGILNKLYDQIADYSVKFVRRLNLFLRISHSVGQIMSAQPCLVSFLNLHPLHRLLQIRLDELNHAFG
jgi:hypothetical protein